MDVGAANLTFVTAEELDQFLENVRWLLEEIYDAEIVDLSGSGRADARGGVWQEGLMAPSLDAVASALAAIENDLDYDAWFKLMAATKAATDGSAEGKELFLEWSASGGKDVGEVSEAKWDSIRPPYAVGWAHLAAVASERSSAFSTAAHEFEPVVGNSVASEPTEIDNAENMWARYAWVESAKRAVDLRTGDLLDQEQFEFRIAPKETVIPPAKEGGKPKIVKTSAWKLFKDEPRRRKSYMHLTCRFGAPVEVVEHLPDLEGVCLNTWREPKRARALPDAASDRDVEPFLRLAAYVIPGKAEREHVFDFMAHTAQKPGEKINHALVLGSRSEGVGKDTLFEPLRAAIGRRYVREIGPPQLTASFNKWLVGCKLVIVQEMHNFERRATMNLLKPLVAAPPEALSVNLKGVQEFFVPNLLSTVFFTNENDALAIQNGDRRYFIAWNDGEPQPKAFYDEVWDWYRAGGIEQVMRWLLSRDISRFNAKGRAPETEAKDAMRKESRAPLQEWIEDGVEGREHPFDRDLVLVEDILKLTPEFARYKGQFPSPQKLGKALKRAGGVCLTEKIRIDGVDGSRRIWALRRVATYAGQSDEVLRALFVKQREEAGKTADALFG